MKKRKQSAASLRGRSSNNKKQKISLQNSNDCNPNANQEQKNVPINFECTDDYHVTSFLSFVRQYPDLANLSLNISSTQLQTTLNLLQDENTIPFLTRYRQTQTGRLEHTTLFLPSYHMYV